MADALSPADVQRLEAAIAHAEKQTSGEIYVVIAPQAGDHLAIPVLWGALTALLAGWPLHLLTPLHTSGILLAQAVVFVVVALALTHPDLRMRAVPSALAGAAARRAAHMQFASYGLHRTEERTGLLVFVALAEHRVEIVADTGIAGAVDPEIWAGLADKVVVDAGRGALADGLERAIIDAGDVLARHFPVRPDDRNELPDRVVLL